MGGRRGSLRNLRYRGGEDARIVTMEGAIRGGGPAVVLTDADPSRTPVDLVASSEDCVPERLDAFLKDAKETAAMVRKALARGQRRYWYCNECKQFVNEDGTPTLPEDCEQEPQNAEECVEAMKKHGGFTISLDKLLKE